MSTRAQVRFATREDGVSFSEHPDKIHAQFYVHSDGYPEGLGLDIAECFTNYGKISNWEIEDFSDVHGDLEYIYYIWQCSDKHPAYISIFEVNYANDDCECCGMTKYRKDESKCIFVGTPEKLITKYGSQLEDSHYKLNTNDDG